MATPLESTSLESTESSSPTSLESTESSSPGTGSLKTETDLEVLVSRLARSRSFLTDFQNLSIDIHV